MSHATVTVAVDCEDSSPSSDVIGALVQEQMEPFDENGCWFRKGSRWDFWSIGGRWSGRFFGGLDIIRRGDLDLTTIQSKERELAIETYSRALDEPEKYREFICGVKPGESEADYIARRCDGIIFPATYAFLKNRRWNERDRMGWFACSATTECEAAGKKVKRCLTRDKKTGAAIVTWREDQRRWGEKFWTRFIRDLDPNTFLVLVDYHV